MKLVFGVRLDMVTDAKPEKLDSPSMALAFQFWEQAKKEFNSDNIIQQKDGCEKAYRAATEAVDVLLASFNYVVTTGNPEAHGIRNNYLEEIIDMNPEFRVIDKDYSLYINKLHGLGFYSPYNPLKYKKVFDSVEAFLQKIQNIIES